MLYSPHISPISNDLYMLDNGFTVISRGRSIQAPTGLLTDGASIPRILWVVLGHPFMGCMLAPAIIHDSLYRSEWLSREEADKIFLDLMLKNGVNKNKAHIYYTGVRLLGWRSWSKHKPENVAIMKQMITVKSVNAL